MQRIKTDPFFQEWDLKLQQKVRNTFQGEDPSHDFSHFHRVSSLAIRLAHTENAKLEVILPAAWLHDLVNLPKNHPNRKLASSLSAEKATEYLTIEGYPIHFLPEIDHAIRAHSFSAQIEPISLEAKIIQDADRLDALGAIGIARCFVVGGQLARPIYDIFDPFSEHRELNDSLFTIDHFQKKLLRIAETLKTPAAQQEGKRRAEFIRQFLKELKYDLM
jgi:uncharacterized protein